MTFALVLIVYILYRHFSKRENFDISKKQFIACITIILIVVSGLRHEAVGNDTFGYMRDFDNIRSMSWSEIFGTFLPRYFSPSHGIGKDPGMDIYLKCLSYIVPTSRIFLFVLAATLLIPLGYFANTYASTYKSIMFAYVFYIVLFFQYLPNSAGRQSIALAIMLFSYLLLNKNKTLLFCLMLLIASTFHKSVLIGFAILPLLHIKNVKLIYVLTIGLFLFVLLNYQTVGSFLGASNDIYGGYLSHDFYSRSSRPYMIIILIAGLYAIGCYALKYDNLYHDHRALYIGSALTLSLVPLVWIDPSALRLISYFGMFMAILIGNSISWIPNGKTIFAIILCAFFLKIVTTQDNYHFMWQEMELHERWSYVLPTDASNNASCSTYFIA